MVTLRAWSGDALSHRLWRGALQVVCLSVPKTLLLPIDYMNILVCSLLSVWLLQRVLYHHYVQCLQARLKVFMWLHVLCTSDWHKKSCFRHIGLIGGLDLQLLLRQEVLLS